MRILMVCPLLSSSSFITTYPMAYSLRKQHDVTIIGPTFGKPMFIKDSQLHVKPIEPRFRSPMQLGYLSLVGPIRNYLEQHTDEYDIVHAFKPVLHTGYAAALAKQKTKKPLVLSIDDYDAAASSNPIKRWALRKAELAVREADAITVSSKRLQELYGGTVIRQVACEPAFTERKPNPSRILKKYNLENKTVIFHGGSFYPHKGIDVLIQAVQELRKRGHSDAVLLLAGGPIEPYRALAGKETIFAGPVPMEEMPDYVAACDIYAIPTKDTPYARAEIPAKIFEAMMLGKSVVASRLSDIPELLANGRAGLLAKPDSVADLEDNMERLLTDARLRTVLGKRAKERYEKEYSYAVIEKQLRAVYKRLV